MFFSVYCNATGEEFVRQLGPNASLDIRAYVAAWADAYGATPSFSEPGASILNGCADYQAEIRRTKAAGSACWSCEPFYLEAVEV